MGKGRTRLCNGGKVWAQNNFETGRRRGPAMVQLFRLTEKTGCNCGFFLNIERTKF